MGLGKLIVILVHLCVQVQGKCKTLQADDRLERQESFEGTYSLIPDKLCNKREIYQKDGYFIYYFREKETHKQQWAISKDTCKNNEYQKIHVYARYITESPSPDGTWEDYDEDTKSWNHDTIYLSCTSDDNTWVWYLSLGGASAMVILGGILIGWCILRRKKPRQDLEVTNLPAAMVTNSDEVSPFA